MFFLLLVFIYLTFSKEDIYIEASKALRNLPKVEEQTGGETSENTEQKLTPKFADMVTYLYNKVRCY